eukprot:6126100-Pyramimonas_sp.AAC.1
MHVFFCTHLIEGWRERHQLQWARAPCRWRARALAQLVSISGRERPKSCATSKPAKKPQQPTSVRTELWPSALRAAQGRATQKLRTLTIAKVTPSKP